jgi:hypothetical protein
MGTIAFFFIENHQIRRRMRFCAAKRITIYAIAAYPLSQENAIKTLIRINYDRQRNHKFCPFPQLRKTVQLALMLDFDDLLANR